MSNNYQEGQLSILELIAKGERTINIGDRTIKIKDNKRTTQFAPRYHNIEREKQSINLKKNFGITKNILNTFSYPQLRRIFYGCYNFSHNESYRVFMHLESYEILQLLYGVGYKSKAERYDLVDFMNEKPLKQIFDIKKSGSSIFEISLEERIGGLNPDIRTAVDIALKQPKIYSDAELLQTDNPEEWDFHDPNIDGKNSAVYIRGIIENINQAYTYLRQTKSK
jgi:hypothetical protein